MRQCLGSATRDHVIIVLLYVNDAAKQFAITTRSAKSPVIPYTDRAMRDAGFSKVEFARTRAMSGAHLHGETATDVYTMRGYTKVKISSVVAQ